MNNRGSLQNPIIVDDAEFAVSYVVNKNNVSLFANPPSSHDDQLLRQAVPADIATNPLGNNKFFKRVKANGRENYFSVIGEPLKKNTKVLARAVSGSPSIMQVALYSSKQKSRADIPEDGYGIDVKHIGYVRKEHLQLDNENKEKFSSPVLRQNIFPNKNLMQDINQSIFGDCYFLAAINGILSRKDGEDYIKSIMTQQGSYTIVRLFDPNSNEFVHYKIKNSIHQLNGKKTVKHQAPWVHILEKAYTYHAHRHKEANVDDSREIVKGYVSFRDIFGGGHPSVAMLVLTGKKAEDIHLPESTQIPWNWNAFMYCKSLADKLEMPPEIQKDLINPEKMDDLIASTIGKITLTESEIKYLRKGLLDDLLRLPLPDGRHPKQEIADFQEKISDLYTQCSNNFMDAHEWIQQYLKEYLNITYSPVFPIANILGKQSLMIEAGKAFEEQVIKPDKLNHFIDEFPSETTMPDVDLKQSFMRLTEFIKLPEAVENKLNELIQPSRDLSGIAHDTNGALGSGRYSNEALNLYDTIQRHAESDHPITASTPAFGNPAPVGLYGNHAYTVLGVYSERHHECDVHYVKLRNPWGYAGRKYKWEGQSLAPYSTRHLENDNGECEIELSDFMRYFYRLTTGEKPDAVVKPLPEQESAPSSSKVMNENLGVVQANIKPARLANATRNGLSILGAAFLGGVVGALIGVVLAPVTGGLSIPIFAAIGFLTGSVLMAAAISKEADKNTVAGKKLSNNANPAKSSYTGQLRKFIGKRHSVTVSQVEEVTSEAKKTEDVIEQDNIPEDSLTKNTRLIH